MENRVNRLMDLWFTVYTATKLLLEFFILGYSLISMMDVEVVDEPTDSKRMMKMMVVLRFYKKAFNEYLDPLASSHFTTEGVYCPRDLMLTDGDKDEGKRKK
ncbi:hypothetical protein HPP92_027110 [Vanilla planifolia]|uniref:Uncharacterized protein n=1 Tax=Vanilla planifolia TaxID=51239 RepID=A0A835U5T1_VANPL|nr:hypothetical protein HPP92_027110 [Vanilla planifolia]